MSCGERAVLLFSENSRWLDGSAGLDWTVYDVGSIKRSAFMFGRPSYGNGAEKSWLERQVVVRRAHLWRLLIMLVYRLWPRCQHEAQQVLFTSQTCPCGRISCCFHSKKCPQSRYRHPEMQLKTMKIHFSPPLNAFLMSRQGKDVVSSYGLPLHTHMVCSFKKEEESSNNIYYLPICMQVKQRAFPPTFFMRGEE